MARKVTIDVEARFIDNVTDEAKAAAKSFDDLEQAAEDTQQDLKNLGKTNAKPKVSADVSDADKKLSRMDKLLNKLGRSKAETKLTAMDRASAIIEKVTSKAKAFAGKTYSALVKLRDSNVLSSLNKMSSGIKGLTSKAWSVAVKIKDTFTAPLTKLKNMLFNVRTLIAGIAGAWAATKLVVAPINLADAYSSAKIGFSTLLGEAGGQQMMDQLDEFAKATPFKTSGVIANAQKMMAMGWDPENIIEDMEVIGNAAAATGKMDQGLESIVRALSQIKTKGKLSTEELNQLAEAGIAAKGMLAEGLGYGTGDSGIAKMTEDLEKGAIQSDVAIQALIAGMHKYDGMMDSMANETVEGLISQMSDAFEINVVRKWGQGLQDGAKKGFGTVIQLLDEAEEALGEFGDMLYEIGKTASNWVADKLQGVLDKVLEISGSFEFQNADLKGKIKMLWTGLVTDPLKEWWEGGGREKTAETAGKVGSWMGEMLTKGLLAIFGATDVLDEKVGSDAGGNIAGSFLQGFLDNFDGQAITDAFVDAIGNIWDALPWWGKMLIGGYGVGKVAGGINSLAGGILNIIGTAATAGAGDTIVAGTGLRGLIGGNVINAAGDVIGATGLRGLIGSTGNAMVGGTGALGKLASAGYALTGGPASAGAYFGAGMSGAAAAGIGAAGIGGGIIGGASLIKGGIDLYKGYHTDDEVEAKALKASGNTAIAATAAGAAIGTAIAPGIGTLIGAGIGGLAGWIGGDAWANNIRAAKYESEEMKEAIKDSDISAEELAQTLKKAKWENAQKHFGDIKLSLSEIERLTDQIVWGDDMANYDQFTTSVNAAEAALKSLKSASETANKWMWKASLGVTFNDDEREAILQSFDEYINSALTLAENKHYEFTAAVSLLVDPESEAGKSILDSGNAFYGKVQEDLTTAGKELGNMLTDALADGFINAEEQAAIVAAQQKIASITEKIANAEQQAELNLINVKFGNGNLDYDSFGSFMEQMQATIDERMQASDKAFVASVSSLNLQLEEDAITQDEYNKQYQALLGGYTATVEGLQAKVTNVELSIIGEAYAKELGDDAVADLNNALQYAIEKDLDPIKISDEKMAELLGNLSLDENGETIKNLKEMLSGVLGHLELLEIDGDLMLKVGEVQTDGPVEEKVVEIVESQIPDTVDEQINLNLISTAQAMNSIEVLAEEFGIEPSYAETILWKLTGTKGIENKLQILCTEFGIEQTRAETVLWKLTGQKQILKPFSLTALDFGIRNSYSASPVVNVTPTLGSVSPITLPTSTLTQKGGNVPRKTFRGGIVGGDSAMDAFARGGRTDNSGIVGGSTRYIRVNEESPEMVIPLSSQRRERALELWNKTGELLDVPGFARGGISNGAEVAGTYPNTIEETIVSNITGEKNIRNGLSVDGQDFGIPGEQAATIDLLLAGVKQVQNAIDVSNLSGDFGVPGAQEQTINMNLTAEKSAGNKLPVLPSDFGIHEMQSGTIGLQLAAEKNIAGKLNVAPDEFGIPGAQKSAIEQRLSAEKSIGNGIIVMPADFGVPTAQESTVTQRINAEKDIDRKLSVLPGDFGIPNTQSSTIEQNLAARKSIGEHLLVSPADFGIPGAQHSTIEQRIGAAKSIGDRLSVLPAEFGIPSEQDSTAEQRIGAQKYISNKLNVSPADFGVPGVQRSTIEQRINAEQDIGRKLDVAPGDFGIPETQDSTIAQRIGAEKRIGDKLSVSPAEFGAPEEQEATVTQKLNAEKSIGRQLQVLGEDFGIPDALSGTIGLQLTAEKSIGNKLQVLASDFGIEDAISNTVNADIMAAGGKFTNITDDWFTGGNEEVLGTDRESQQIDRRMAINNEDEGIRHNTYGGGETAGGRTVQVNMGGFKLEVNVSGSDKESVAEAIKAQAGELADYIVGQIADALEIEFENTPVRGGNA